MDSYLNTQHLAHEDLREGADALHEATIEHLYERIEENGSRLQMMFMSELEEALGDYLAENGYNDVVAKIFDIETSQRLYEAAKKEVLSESWN